jgi:hypothetical protein
MTNGGHCFRLAAGTVRIGDLQQCIVKEVDPNILNFRGRTLLHRMTQSQWRQEEAHDRMEYLSHDRRGSQTCGLQRQILYFNVYILSPSAIENATNGG